MNKPMMVAILAAILALSLLGCGKREGEPTDANQSTTAQLKDKADQALQDATELLAKQKDKLLQASQEQLDKLDQQVGQWLNDVGTDDAETQQKLTALSKRFRDALADARSALETARQSGLDAWEQSKPTVEAALKKARLAHEEITTFLKAQVKRQSQQTEPDTVEE